MGSLLQSLSYSTSFEQQYRGFIQCNVQCPIISNKYFTFVFPNTSSSSEHELVFKNKDVILAKVYNHWIDILEQYYYNSSSIMNDNDDPNFVLDDYFFKNNNNKSSSSSDN